MHDTGRRPCVVPVSTGTIRIRSTEVRGYRVNDALSRGFAARDARTSPHA
jgi:hypothetical protein